MSGDTMSVSDEDIERLEQLSLEDITKLAFLLQLSETFYQEELLPAYSTFLNKVIVSDE